MSWADWNRSRGGGLGSLFFLNEEGQLEVSPEFWAYRVYLRDNHGRYWSPSKAVRGEGLNLGQEPVYMGDENKEHGVGRRISDDNGRVFERIRGMDDVYDELAENEDIYETDQDNDYLEKMSDNDILANIFGHVGSAGNGAVGRKFGEDDSNVEAYILDQGAGDRAGRVIVTGAPYEGISIIGAAHPRYNIFGTNDIDPLVLHGVDYKVNQHNKGNAVGATALAHDAIRRLNANGKKAWGGYDTPIDHVLVESLKSGGGPLWMEALTAGDRERLGSARTWRELKSILNDIDLENAKQYGRQYAISTFYPNDRISGAIITDAAPFGAAGTDFDNMMHDKVVEAIMRSLDRFRREEPLVREDNKGNIIWKSGPEDVRLVQVAVPLKTAFGDDNLFNVDDIREGRVHGQRSDMNEYLARVVRPFNDIGSAAEFLGNGAENPFRLYWLDRLKGIPASVAWKERLGERFGDMETLISDEELKDTKRLAREACEPLLRQCMITNGIMRGPGNG